LQSFTNEISGNHFLDGTLVDGVGSYPDHGDVESREDDETASHAGLLAPVVHRIQSEKGRFTFTGHFPVTKSPLSQN